jgi:hypothetical protein
VADGTDSARAHRNSTIAGLSSTASLTTVFEEVTKYNVHLNVFERLWAVRAISRARNGTREHTRS